jgi:hypothetical protein
MLLLSDHHGFEVSCFTIVLFLDLTLKRIHDFSELVIKPAFPLCFELDLAKWALFLAKEKYKSLSLSK